MKYLTPCVKGVRGVNCRDMTTPANVWILHTDGACKGNPGPSGVGIALYKPGATEPTHTVAERIPNTTNNVAEYAAFIRGLKEALLRGAERLEVRTDSELMAHQLNGRYKVSAPQILPLYTEAKGLIARFASVRVVHIPREQNALADKLANQGVAAGLAPKVAATAKPAAETVPVSRFADYLDATAAEFAAGDTPTVRQIADYMKRVLAAPNQPVVLDTDGNVVENGDAVVRAYIEGRAEVAVIRRG